MNNKIKLRLGFLKKYKEFDRNIDTLNPIAGGCSKATCRSIENELKNGGKINKPVQFTIDLNDNTGLLDDGNHRITSCENAGLSDDFEIPVLLRFLRGRHFMDRKKAKKFKKLAI